MGLIKYSLDYSSLSEEQEIISLLNRINKYSFNGAFTNPHLKQCEFFIERLEIIDLINVPDSCYLKKLNR